MFEYKKIVAEMNAEIAKLQAARDALMALNGTAPKVVMERSRRPRRQRHRNPHANWYPRIKAVLVRPMRVRDLAKHFKPRERATVSQVVNYYARTGKLERTGTPGKFVFALPKNKVVLER